MRNVALVPQSYIFEANQAVSPDNARQTAYSLRKDGVSLVRHRARPLLPFPEPFLSLAYFRPLPVADLKREFVQRRRDYCERAQILGVTIPLDHLGRGR